MRILWAVLSAGALQYTQGPVTGVVPLQVQESGGARVRNCTVSGGYVSHCDAPYTGQTVLPSGGKYKECKVSAGWVTSCSATGYTGRAADLLGPLVQ